MNHSQIVHILNIVVYTSFLSSLVNLVLPPWELFNDYPSFQKGYKFLILLLSNIGLNARGKSIQTLYSQTAPQILQSNADATATKLQAIEDKK